MTELIKHPEFGEIRVEMVDGEPWFVAGDVCGILGLEKTESALRKLDDDEKGAQVFSTPGGRQEMLVVNESGMYALIMRSNKPTAKRFRKWVTSEVLPALRKTGAYKIGGVGVPVPEPPELIWHDGAPCIEAGWLIENGIMSLHAYKSLVHRGRIDRLRRSCYSTPALVSYLTLPETYKSRIVCRFGKPVMPISDDRLSAILLDICLIDDRALRLSLVEKLTSC